MTEKILFGGLLFFISFSLFAQNTVLLIDTTFRMSIFAGDDVVYINNYSESKYKTTFIDNLWQAFRDQNIQMEFSVDENAEPYTVHIVKYRLSEEVHTETVEDTASGQYGQTYQLSDCKIEVEYVLSMPNHKTVGAWKVSLSREETLSNSQNFFEWLFGLNKDHTEYHEKTLSSDVFLFEIQKIAKKMTKKTEKKIKKNKQKKS